jgi:hypothetical protein
MGQHTKKNQSDIKNFWLFRIAGMLAAIGRIKYEMTNKSNDIKVIEFNEFLSEAEDSLRNANDLLRKIDYTNIVK